MPKFEITNPEAIKLIEDIKTGKFIEPYLDKLRKIKKYLIATGIVLVLIIFMIIGKSLAKKTSGTGYVPPKLEINSQPASVKAVSPYSELKEEIFVFSADLPDPVLPSISNSINLKPELQ